MASFEQCAIGTTRPIPPYRRSCQDQQFQVRDGAALRTSERLCGVAHCPMCSDCFHNASFICLPTRGRRDGPGEFDTLKCLKSKSLTQRQPFLSKSSPLSLHGASNSPGIRNRPKSITRDPDSISLSNSRLSGMVFCLKPCVCSAPPGGQNIDRCIIAQAYKTLYGRYEILSSAFTSLVSVI